MANLIILIFDFQRDRHRTAADPRQSFGFLHFQFHVNRITDKNGFDELPFIDFPERDHRSVEDSRLPGKTGSDCQSQQPMSDLSAEYSCLAELRVGVNAVVIA